jgi:hypothetical protein
LDGISLQLTVTAKNPTIMGGKGGHPDDVVKREIVTTMIEMTTTKMMTMMRVGMTNSQQHGNTRKP